MPFATSCRGRLGAVSAYTCALLCLLAILTATAPLGAAAFIVDAAAQTADAGAAAAGGNGGAVTLQTAGETAKNFGVRVFWAVVVVALTFYLVKGAAFVLNKLAERSASRRLVLKRAVPIVRLLLWIVGAYVVIRGIFEVDSKGVFAAAAAIGVAVGFAAQELLRNFFGGLVIISDRPFQIGDKVRIGDIYGEVVSIGLRSTRIVTPDDSLVTVPNARVMTDPVANANAGALDCQVVTDLYLPGWVDEAAAKRIAYEAATSSKYVYMKKPIVVLVSDEFKETFLTHLKVKAYVFDARYEFLLMSEITERARRAFREHGLLRHSHGARVWMDLSAMDGGTAAERAETSPTATEVGATAAEKTA